MSIEVKVKQGSTPWALSQDESGQWYWGEVDFIYEEGCMVLIARAGPFPTATEAALDMMRTWVTQSVAAGRPN